MSLPTDYLAQEAIELAPSDPWGAAEALRIAARYIREGKPLPPPLDDYLAGAIEAAMHKAPEHRGSALLLELNLKALNRKPGRYWLEVGKFVEFHRDPDVAKGMTYEGAVAMAADIFKIHDSTVRRYWRQFKKHLKENGLETSEEITSLKQFIKDNNIVLQNSKNSQRTPSVKRPRPSDSE